MESTVRFDSSGEYKCKPVNRVSAHKYSSIENISNVNCLAVRKFASILVDVDYQDTDFTFKVKSILMKPVSGTATDPYKVKVYLVFGYPHNIFGLPIVLNVDDTGKDLEIIKSNGTITVKFNNAIIDSLSEVVGPIKHMYIKPIQNIIDPTDTSVLADFYIGDIEYNS